MLNQSKRRTIVTATCRIDIHRVLISVMNKISNDYDDLHLIPSVEGWPCVKRDPLTEFKYPDENMLKLQMYGSFINHIYYNRQTKPFQYAVHGIKIPFAIVAETKVREVVSLLKYDGLVGRYNDVVLSEKYISVVPTDEFIALKRLQRGEELCLPPELDLIT